MPSDLEEGGRSLDGAFEGISRRSIDDAIRRAVDEAKQPHGTWLRIDRIEVLSVDDPNVGGYKVEITPSG